MPICKNILKMRLSFAVIFLAGCLLTKQGEAQRIPREAKFKRIESNAQLSNLNIACISQDSKGFLWVGTSDGLNRFDGYEFKTYRNIENDSNSLVKNTIQTIFEDSYGTLWTSTINSGLHFYDRATDAFHRIPKFSQRHCQIFRITEDSNHNLWIGGAINAYAFVAMRDHQKGTWEEFKLFPAVEGIYSIIQSAENEYWLGSQADGLFLWNKKTNHLRQYQHDPNNPNSLPGNFVREIVQDARGNLWLGTHDGGLCKFEIKNNSYTNFTIHSKAKTTIPSNTIRSMCWDGNYLWIGTENGGLSKMDMTTGMLTNYLYNNSDPNSIINNSIWSVYKDRQGRIWVGSFARGLCVLDALEDKIPLLDISMDGDLVNAIVIDSKNRMWIGTEDGLVLRDKTGSYRFRSDPENKSTISSNAINCIFEDRKHRVWIGVWNGGINRFVENSKSFVRYLPDSKTKTLTNADVFSITEYSKTGELLLSTFGGLNILKDEQAGIFENPFKYPSEGDQIQFTLLEDSKHNIWVGARSGLSLYSLENKTTKRIDILGDTTRVSDQINCIYEDHKATLWIGSSGGLHQMISPTKFITYTTKDGLPVNFVQGILEDAKGNLWLGTTKGLTFFNTVTKTFKTFDKSDGLLSAELRRKSFFKSKEGQLFIGGNGINSFFPDSIFSNPYKPSVYITDLKIFNRTITPKTSDGILKDDIAVTKEIYLNHSQTFFSLHYVGINFTSSYKNEYAYKLEGFDKDWVKVGTQRFATFTNLDPGTYTFKVRASNNDGLWNEDGASLIIHVLPPWWKTWWFRVLSSIGLGTAFVLIIVLRTKRIERVNRILEETVDQKTKQIREQNQKLKEQSEELASQYEELVQSQEETSTQRDLLSQQNRALQESQKTIEKQNENLELEVAKRTKELVEYNHQLEQFAFITAHNLRAPVARILGLGQLLGLAKGNSEDKDEIYPKLVNTAKEIDGVVKDLNTILELKKNNESYITNIDLAAVISMIKVNLEREIEATQTSITTDFTQVGSLLTVKPYLDSILYNLVSNAIKYRHPERKPVIHIKTTKSENEICLSVADNGLGIDMAHSQTKLFTLYSRFHDHVEGKGMGLYLVKTQLIAMGGRVEVESEVGKGTTFKAYFKKENK